MTITHHSRLYKSAPYQPSGLDVSVHDVQVMKGSKAAEALNQRRPELKLGEACLSLVVSFNLVQYISLECEESL